MQRVQQHYAYAVKRYLVQRLRLKLVGLGMGFCNQAVSERSNARSVGRLGSTQAWRSEKRELT